MSYNDHERLLTVYEVADILKLSVLTIYKYIRTNELEVLEFGGHYRISESSLASFIQNHTVNKKRKEDAS